MSNIFALTKILIKNNGFSFSVKNKEKKSKGTNPIAYILLLVFCVACLGGPVIFSLSVILKQYDLSSLILSFLLPIGGITTILFGVFSIVSVFYFNKDSEQLLHMPIKSSELLIAKFITSLLSEYLILLLFIYPVIFGVGIGIGASVLYYVYTFIICLLMPIIPTVIMSIIIMLTNKIFKFGKRKDSFMYIMTAIILVFSFAYSFGVEYVLNVDDSSSLLTVLSGNSEKYLKISEYIFPFFNSATYSLINYNSFIGFASVMTFIGLNLLFMVILFFVGEKLYIKGLTNNTGNRREKKDSKTKDYKTSKTGVIGELIKKEWIVMKRTPVYMINIFLGNLIFPIVLVVSFFAGMSNSGESVNLSNYINLNNGGALLVSIGILVLFSAMTTAAGSAISREGNSAWYMKTIPVSLKRQIDAKVSFAVILDVFVLLLCETIMLISFNAPWYYFLLLSIPAILLLFVINYLAILIDLAKPKLDWSNETEAVKQNFNSFIVMMMILIISMVISAVGVLLYMHNANIYLIFTLTCVILLGINIAINLFISRKQSRLFNKVG